MLAGCADGGGARAEGAPQREVRIAAASDLKFALEELQPLLDEQHPGVVMRTTYGSSGTFLQQLSNGAPFDLFLSADLAYPQQLAAEGLAEPADVFPYAVGRLVLWTPEGSPVDPAPGLGVADRPAGAPGRRSPTPSTRRTAGPPSPRCAATRLEDAVQPKLVLGESVSQAAEFVQSGSADAGIVAMSLVLSDPLRDQGRWVEVPLTDFPQLLQGGVVLADAQDPAAARAVRDTLLSEPGRELLRRYGFSLPDSAR